MAEATFTQLDDDALQAHFLLGVSRTFALTIPRLPLPLSRAVANAYLLCRIVDTVEDEVELTREEKNQFCDLFSQVVANQASAADFTTQLAPRLSQATLPAEHELIAATSRVVAITHGFSAAERHALERCIRIMSHGMGTYQGCDLSRGLDDMEDMSRYCYYVAGVVGEMLTDLFCEFDPEILRQRDQLLPLSVSFGQGLQMTNILKDMWDDRSRGVIWLPRSVFSTVGYDLTQLSPNTDVAYAAAMEELIATAHGHLRNALEYTLRIPKRHVGVRDFCLWAIGMAVLTLRRINRHRHFSSATEVKITRREVYATIGLSRITHRSDLALRLVFAAMSQGLPTSHPAPVAASVLALAH